jgi:type II secretory pathway pseudopilin PulG
VIIIIGILAAIAIPVFLAQREKAVIATCKSNARNAAAAAVVAAAEENASFATLEVNDLQTAGFNQTQGYTTTVNWVAADNALNISTACPNPPGGTATWTSGGRALAGGAGAGQIRGEVVYNAPVAAGG